MDAFGSRTVHFLAREEKSLLRCSPTLLWLGSTVGLLLLAITTVAVAQKPPGSAQVAANFVDIAPKAGLTAPNVFGGKTTKKYILETTGTGVAIFDYDGDGWPDIFFVNGTTLEGFPKGQEPTNHLYRNTHDGKFIDVTERAGLRASGWGQGACVGDYDNDGLPDLYVTYYGRNRLYHNNGNGTFTDVTDAAGVGGSGKSWGTGCAFVDYDRDGLLDLIVANYVEYDQAASWQPGSRPSCMWKGAPVMCGPRGMNGAKNTLFHNLGKGRFEDVTVKAHIDQTPGTFCFSPTTLDYDNDGWPDIYVACDSTPNILYHNNRDGTFTDVGVVSGVAFNEDGRAQAGMGSTSADYDGDGQLDLFRTNFSDDTSTLFRNNGNGTFADTTFAAGLGLNTKYLGWGTMFFDFDNDGWPDLLLINGHVYPEVETYNLGSSFEEPRLLYHNQGNGTFADISANSGTGIATRSAGRGLAIGDLWNDGRLSAVISNMNSTPSLLVNQAACPTCAGCPTSAAVSRCGAGANHWITFKTIGTRSNRDGIGARITVRITDRQSSRKRTLVDEVRSGSSYMSSNDIRVHFGLGAITKIDDIEVRWPSGLTEHFDAARVDSIVTLKEGSGKSAAQKNTATRENTVTRALEQAPH